MSTISGWLGENDNELDAEIQEVVLNAQQAAEDELAEALQQHHGFSSSAAQIIAKDAVSITWPHVGQALLEGLAIQQRRAL